MKQMLMGTIQVLFLLVPFSTLISQEAIPAKVLDTFKARYGDISLSEVEWNDDDDLYQAAFYNEDGQYVLVGIDDEGMWLKTETQIDEYAIPVKILELIKKGYSDLDYYTEVKHVETPKMQAYIVRFETSKDYVSLTFDMSGKLLDKESEPLDN